MFQRKKQELPTFGGGGGGNNNGGFLPMARPGSDGSGRGIKMDAPIVAGWKRANGFTKGSYYFLGFFFFLIFIGIRSLRFWSCTFLTDVSSQFCSLGPLSYPISSLIIVFLYPFSIDMDKLSRSRVYTAANTPGSSDNVPCICARPIG